MFSRFRGGVHPRDSKELTKELAVESIPAPEILVLPLRQHIGAVGIPVVNVGDCVKIAQPLSRGDGFVSSPIHAPVSGKVIEIKEYPHVSGTPCISIVLQNDGMEEWALGLPMNRDWEKLNADSIRTIVQECGIVGLGGAAFPAHVKLAPPKDKKIEQLILNGVECEPYLTADYRLMLEHAEQVAVGMKIVMKTLGIDRGIVGIEGNKPEAVEAMKQALAGTSINVVSLPVKYPQGAEKMLIKALTGLEVPAGGLPSDVGVVVQNAGTVLAVYEAVVHGIPLIERVVTVSGDCVREPKNLKIRLGTTFQGVIDYCGGLKQKPEKILMGGPMMGFAQSSLDVSVIKGVSGILALSKAALHSGKESSCIRCGRCVNACPMGLVPSMLSILGERNKIEEARTDYGLLNCIECGSCVYACPAKRNIVQHIRFTKAKNAATKSKVNG